MATVYLHIGTPKTGTTAIQNFLSDNNEILNKYGICYPDFGFRYPKIGVLRNAHFLLTADFDENGQKSSQQPGKDYESGLDMIADLAKTYDKIIISDEAIWRGSSGRDNFWPKLKYDLWKRSLDIKIIVYLRRQDLWMPSFWGQKIKTGSVLHFQEYLQFMDETDYPTDYFQYMEMLSSIFGEESLIIRVYEKGQYKGEKQTLISDFLDIFGLPLGDEFYIRQDLYNLSLKGNYAEIRRILNILPDFYETDHILKRSIWDTQKLNPEPDLADNYTWNSPDEQRAYLAAFADSNEQLARKYLHREDGILFYEPVKDYPRREPDEQSLTRDILLVYGRALQLLELEMENQSLKKEMKKLEAQIESLRKYVPLYHLKNAVWHILGKDKPTNGKK